MFKIIICAVALVAATASASSQSCCSANEDFAALGKKASFRAAHAKPRVPDAPVHQGEAMSVTVSDGKPANIVMYRSKSKPQATILVIHEWWGLNDNVKNAAHEIYEELEMNVDVIAVDLYDGFVTDKREEAANAMQNADATRITNILNAVIGMSRSEKIATIGWCFGGGWSLQASLLAGKKASACVIYYGMPEKSIDKLKMLNAPVLGVFATEDKWITPQLVTQFQSDMTTAGKSLMMKMYKADHAFANPSNPQYDSEATNDAWATSMEFFRTHLMQ